MDTDFDTEITIEELKHQIERLKQLINKMNEVRIHEDLRDIGPILSVTS